MFSEGQQIGYYTLLRFLGRGAFGEVWLAENSSLTSPELVAIKLPRNDDFDLQAVKDEIFNWQLAGRHKNILPIIECEPFGDRVAIVSEFAPDGSLKDLLEIRGSLSVDEAVEITIEILDGLAHLHKKQVIHRDLKPDNVLFQGKIPRLTDFGISRAMPVDSYSTTNPGTAWYMSPEALNKKRNAQTDIWSVGVILYQLLTGNLPFPQDDLPSLVTAVLYGEPEPLPDNIPVALQKIVKKSLAKESAKRYQTAIEMREALRNALSPQKFAESQTISQAKTIVIDDFDKTAKLEMPPVQEASPHIEDNGGETELRSVQTEIKTAVRQKIIDARIGEDTDKTEQLIVEPINDWQEIEVEKLAGEQPQHERTDIKPYDEIIKDCTKAIELAPHKSGTARAYFERGHAYFDKGDYAKAFEDFDQAIELDEFLVSSFPYQYNVKEYTKTIELNPNAADAYVHRGDAYRVLGNDREAIADYRRALEIDPSLKDAKNKLQIALKKRNQDDDFDKTEQVVIEPNKHWPEIEDGKSNDRMRVANSDDRNQVEEAERFETEVDLPTPKTNRLYFAIPTLALLLFSIIGGGLWLNGGANKNKQTIATNTSTNDFPKPVSTPTSLQDKEVETLLIPFRKGYKMGFCDSSKKLIVEAKYDVAKGFSEGLAAINLNKKWGYIDKAGKEVIPPKYDYTSSFFNGLADVRLNNKYGFIDKTGQEVIPLRYDFVLNFSKDDLAMVALKDKHGFIDKTGQEIIPLKYDEAGTFSQGLAPIKSNKKWGYVDVTGQVVIPLKYDQAFLFSKEGLAPIESNNKYGFIDKTGKEIIHPKYNDAFAFTDEGLALVGLNRKKGFINQTGQEVTPMKYDGALPFSEGLALVGLNEKWGYIDVTGQEIIPLKYDNSSMFSEGLAGVKLNKKWGFIDKTGKEVIPMKYDDLVFNFIDGFAVVKLGNIEFYIDKNGTEYYEP